MKKTSYTPVKQDHVDEGVWIYSYADLVTLLLGFFIIVTAFSTPDPEKFEMMRKATSDAMKVEYINQYQTLSRELEQVMAQKILDGEAEITQLTDGLKISGQAGNFFDSGSASMKPKAIDFLKKVGTVLLQNLKSQAFIVEIQGHTDDVPIHTVEFPSNWELSLRRSSEVVRLFEELGFPHAQLRPAGLSDTDPSIKMEESFTPKEKENARAENRRIVIRIRTLLTERKK